MKKNAVPEHVTYEQAKGRIIAWWYQNKFNRPIPLHWFADGVWPGHRMKAQGAAFAVSRIIHKMREQGVVRLGLSIQGGHPGYVVIEKKAQQ